MTMGGGLVDDRVAEFLDDTGAGWEPLVAFKLRDDSHAVAFILAMTRLWV